MSDETDGRVDDMEPEATPSEGRVGDLESEAKASEGTDVGRRDLLVEELSARLGGKPWEVTLVPTHEFYQPGFASLYATHGIRRFVTYVVTLRRHATFRLRRHSLSPWHKAACSVRVAQVRTRACLPAGTSTPMLGSTG